MSHAAQCMLCKHARRRGNQVVGCLRFEEARVDPDVGSVLEALIYQLSGKGPCVAREKLEYGPDAYIAQDLPAGP